MANIYVSHVGSNTSPYDTWAKAATTLAAAVAIDAAGDTIWVKSTHSESTAGAINLAWAGTTASPSRVICVSDSNEPPTTVATGAVVATTGANDLAIATSGTVYFYGIRFKAGDSTNAADIVLSASAGSCVVCNSCSFELAGNNSGSDITQTSSGGLVILQSCTFKVANAGSACIAHTTSFCKTVLNSCSIEAGGVGSSPAFVFQPSSQFEARGCDFSGIATDANLCSSATYLAVVGLFDCKLPASWSGSINASTPGFGSVFQIVNTDSSDTNYRLWRKTSFGDVTHETTIKRTGGASDGTTGLSWKMVSNADAEWSHQTLDSPEIVKWNETTGSSVTATVEFVHDSVTNMTDKEIWLEVMYLSTSGVPLGSFITDAAANYLSSAADQTDSSEAWTTTGLTNPNSQKLSVSFTPQEKGFVHAVVKVAAASKTVYVDPVLTLA